MSLYLVSYDNCFELKPLLSYRKVETVSNWLLEHPEIKIITPDGSSSYAAAATKGDPQVEK